MGTCLKRPAGKKEYLVGESVTVKDAIRRKWNQTSVLGNLPMHTYTRSIICI
jgi:hypothetical protein